ncbi:MAG: UDP-N-acetylmuramate--L-alanine ligase [Planctomycetota bacterium]
MITTRFRNLHIHLVGIGGAGVSALVPLLLRVGARISGCDEQDSSVLRRLRERGITCLVGHDPAHLAQADLVVHTAAMGRDHPELATAIARGIPVMTRGECLVKLMEGSRTIAISGSHGKTTTTWMTGHLLTEAGLDPVVMVGGSVQALDGGGARAGAGDTFIAETDESDGSFATVDPEIAVLTNLDHEHLRHYGSFAALEDAFNSWLRRIPAHGAVIVPSEGLSDRVLSGVRCRVIRCGLNAGDWHATNLELGPDGSRMHVIGNGHDMGEILVTIPGAHMALNAIMACAAARQAEPKIDLSALSRCERVRRRFTVHGDPAGIRVVEDYGHHPTEVRATIAAARLAGGRVHVLFQPHRYTRTADCFDAFTAAFDQAHGVAILPVYAASEEPIPGVNSADLAQAIRQRRVGMGEETVTHVSDGVAAIQHLAAMAMPGDTVLVLGAGDVGRLAPQVVDFFINAPGRESAGVEAIEA